MKYTDEELIQLISLNPGFGLDRLIKQILPGSDADKRRDIRYDIIQLLAEYKKEFGDDLYAEIQNPDYIQYVTENEYKEITGEKYLPQGRYLGRSTSRSSKLSDGFGKGHNTRGGAMANIPLPPQTFEWGAISKPHERSTEHYWDRYSTESRANDVKSRLLFYSPVKLRNFKEIWSAYQYVLPVEDYSLVSRFVDDCSRNVVVKWLPRMKQFHELGILEEWLEITEQIKTIEENGNFQDKEALLAFRGTFEEYVKRPEENEAPSKEDIFWVFNELNRN